MRYIAFWVGGRRVFVSGIDGDFVLFSADPQQTVAIEDDSIDWAIGVIVEHYDPDRISLDRRGLTFHDLEGPG